MMPVVDGNYLNELNEICGMNVIQPPESCLHLQAIKSSSTTLHS